MAKDTQETVTAVSDFVNSFVSKGQDFCNLMTHEHRTLQQSFTKLCLQWLETVAGEDYRTDLRNEASQGIARNLLKGEDYSGEPSKYLPMV